MEHEMTRLTHMLALALCLGLTGGAGALAQESAAPAEGTAADTGAGTGTEAPAAPADPASDLSLGAVEGAPDGVGTTYTQATFEAWEQRCIRTADGSDPCQLYQLLKDANGNAVAEISMFGLPDGQPAAAGATIVVPLETLLTEQLMLAIDSAPAKRYPFSWCAAVGCFARVGFTAEEVDAFRRGAVATMTIVPVAAPDQKVVLEMSLQGFTAGFEAVTAANAD
jgi:invasion protein IalB